MLMRMIIMILRQYWGGRARWLAGRQLDDEDDEEALILYSLSFGRSIIMAKEAKWIIIVILLCVCVWQQAVVLPDSRLLAGKWAPSPSLSLLGSLYFLCWQSVNGMKGDFIFILVSWPLSRESKTRAPAAPENGSLSGCPWWVYSERAKMRWELHLWDLF